MTKPLVFVIGGVFFIGLMFTAWFFAPGYVGCAVGVCIFATIAAAAVGLLDDEKEASP
jgi:hypothetical protein